MALKPLSIGPYRIEKPVLVAPMAGVTDRPYRQLCRRFGAAYAVSEMAASNPALWKSVKTSQRLNHEGEPAPIAVQLAGANPLNMGCPAKKVCALAAGSALMGQESLALEIVEAVVEALAHRREPVPVTVKMRTGINTASRNVRSLALAMASIGVSMIVVHGRTREQGFSGAAAYEDIGQVKASLSIPVIANGDIDSAAKAREVLAQTGCDGLMVGRAALGRPWLFAQIAAELAGERLLAEPSLDDLSVAMQAHFEDHLSFYGEASGLRSIRKHVAWYLPQWARLSALQQVDGLPAQAWAEEALQRFYRIGSSAEQWQFLNRCMHQLMQQAASSGQQLRQALPIAA
ncbi:MAG: tRNA dihydrouridine synthase DusB [Betaproteobacteria bacterium]|nr:tRNA dihydrouridine synthase DusB [Betaproteobacteria bacterium]